MTEDVIRLENVRTYFKLDEGILKAVDGVSFAIARGKTLGVIGESGCGKSVTAQSVLRIVPLPGWIAGGRILLSRPREEMERLYRQAALHPPQDDRPLDLASLDDRGRLIRSIRGKVISMIFQEPMTSLSPVHTIGSQIMEAVLLHRTDDKKEAREIAESMLAKVGIGNPAQRINEYPHQFSGGMRQRAMIAMALSCNPALLIADEPTTALDVTVQAQIIELIKELQEQYGMGIQYITHDLGVIAEVADEVAVMYLGRIVEQGTSRQIFKEPRHPYTRLLLKSIPSLGRKARTRLEAIKGTVPTPLDPPVQCGFLERCPEAMVGRCDRYIPALMATEDGHRARCFLHSDRVEAPPTPDDLRPAPGTINKRKKAAAEPAAIVQGGLP